METSHLVKQMPDQWTYRISQNEFSGMLSFVKDRMKKAMVQDSGKSEGFWKKHWNKLIAERYNTDESKGNGIFDTFCTVVTKALFFKELHAYLFPYGRDHQLWRNPVLSKLSDITDREMFFLMARNSDLLQTSIELDDSCFFQSSGYIKVA